MDISLVSYIFKRIKSIIWPNVEIHESTTPMIIEKDVSVALRDKNIVKVNIFRPTDDKPHPVIISFHPYGKDNFPKRGWFGYKPPIQYRILFQPETVHFSSLTTWEAPDPEFWVKHGYIVINGDMRGAGTSEGVSNLLTDQEGEDYYDLIEWAGVQAWSNGKVGLCGVSYLALSQYKVAGFHPPHLAAICPWEGFSDVYKDLARPGGIREDGFFAAWAGQVAPAMRVNQKARITRDAWWQTLIPNLKNITVPALVCGSFSDQYLHTTGSFRVYNEISSKHKWLYTHRTGKWLAFYSDEAKALQLKFFDYFLKGENNGMLSLPSVRLEVRTSRNEIHRVNEETNWPLQNITWLPLYLDAEHSALSKDKPIETANVKFEVKSGTAKFRYSFEQNVELIGPMKLKVYVEAINCNDLPIFVGVRKFHRGKEVYFEGSYGYGYDIVTKACQRASLRELAKVPQQIWQAEHTFEKQQWLSSGEIVCLDIPLPPSATYFQSGDELCLEIKGNAIVRFNPLLSQVGKYEKNTQGSAIIYAGGRYDSQLILPWIAAK